MVKSAAQMAGATMAVETSGPDLLSVVVLLGAGVVAVPLSKRLGLGSLLGYLVTGVGSATGLPVAHSFVAGPGFVLTSTAIVMQLLEERGETATPQGQRMVS